MATIQWGIIGCGDVTEVKSGPAFNKVSNSKLVAVMRRNEEKVKDYAKRHGVEKWYTNADDLINDAEVNAIYIATPPLQHEQYTIAAIKAGKPVYVEKPMAVNVASAQRMADAANAHKVSVAHYRRAQPLFIKLKELLDAGMIGQIKYVDIKLLQPALTAEEMQNPKVKWRLDPLVAGGGLFHDLAPHQLDLMIYFFGEVEMASGLSSNQAGLYEADDLVTGNLRFKNGIVCQGLWSFSAPESAARETCEITGTEGKITFSVFGAPEIFITKKGRTSTITFEKPEHVQQPMIEKVVNYFLGNAENPSPVEAGVTVMNIMDSFTSK